jgi:hypothetical protein
MSELSNRYASLDSDNCKPKEVLDLRPVGPAELECSSAYSDDVIESLEQQKGRVPFKISSALYSVNVRNALNVALHTYGVDRTSGGANEVEDEMIARIDGDYKDDEDDVCWNRDSEFDANYYRNFDSGIDYFEENEDYDELKIEIQKEKLKCKGQMSRHEKNPCGDTQRGAVLASRRRKDSVKLRKNVNGVDYNLRPVGPEFDGSVMILEVRTDVRKSVDEICGKGMVPECVSVKQNIGETNGNRLSFDYDFYDNWGDKYLKGDNEYKSIVSLNRRCGNLPFGGDRQRNSLLKARARRSFNEERKFKEAS